MGTKGGEGKGKTPHAEFLATQDVSHAITQKTRFRQASVTMSNRECARARSARGTTIAQAATRQTFLTWFVFVSLHGAVSEWEVVTMLTVTAVPLVCPFSVTDIGTAQLMNFFMDGEKRAPTQDPNIIMLWQVLLALGFIRSCLSVVFFEYFVRS